MAVPYFGLAANMFDMPGGSRSLARRTNAELC